MITTYNEIRQLRKESLSIIKEGGLLKEFNKLKRKLSRQLNLDIFIYKDTCKEGYDGILFVGEVIQDFPFNLVYTTISPDLREIIRQLEEYIDE